MQGSKRFILIIFSSTHGKNSDYFFISKEYWSKHLHTITLQPKIKQNNNEI